MGNTEILLLLMLLTLPYGIWMTVDALRRPAEEFRAGVKPVWVGLLVVTNPILAKYVAPYAGLVAVPVFLALSIAYHVINRRQRPVGKA